MTQHQKIINILCHFDQISLKFLRIGLYTNLFKYIKLCKITSVCLDRHYLCRNLYMGLFGLIEKAGYRV